jgi:rhodanese-related sulfurtransferase
MDHTKAYVELVNESRGRIREVSVAEAQERMNHGAHLIDVREDNEWAASHAKGASHLGRGIIERDIEANFPDRNTELILYCGGGFRSALAADNLQRMGYKNVYSMAGGWTAWTEAKGPVE